jgi:hypothetical protein
MSLLPELDLTLDLTTVTWPEPWRPLTDEAEALAFGRVMNSEVACTVLGELHREIGAGHPLFGVECQPIAFNAEGEKEFLFLTNRPDKPLAMVHFTWHTESDPYYPSVMSFSSIADFLERNYISKSSPSTLPSAEADREPPAR